MLTILLIILLKFSDNKGQASQFMEGHKAEERPTFVPAST